MGGLWVLEDAEAGLAQAKARPRPETDNPHHTRKDWDRRTFPCELRCVNAQL